MTGARSSSQTETMTASAHVNPIAKYGIDLFALLPLELARCAFEADLGDGRRLANATIAAALTVATPRTQEAVLAQLNRARRHQVAALLPDAVGCTGRTEARHAVAEVLDALRRTVGRGPLAFSISPDLCDPEHLPGWRERFALPAAVRQGDGRRLPDEEDAGEAKAPAQAAPPPSGPRPFGWARLFDCDTIPRLAADASPAQVYHFWDFIRENGAWFEAVLDPAVDQIDDPVVRRIALWALDEHADADIARLAEPLFVDTLATLERRLAMMAATVLALQADTDQETLWRRLSGLAAEPLPSPAALIATVTDKALASRHQDDTSLAACLLAWHAEGASNGLLRFVLVFDDMERIADPYLRWGFRLLPVKAGPSASLPGLEALLHRRARAIIAERDLSLRMNLAACLAVRDRVDHGWFAAAVCADLTDVPPHPGPSLWGDAP